MKLVKFVAIFLNCYILFQGHKSGKIMQLSLSIANEHTDTFSIT